MPELDNASQSQSYDIMNDPKVRDLVAKTLKQLAKDPAYYRSIKTLSENVCGQGGDIRLRYADPSLRLLGCTAEPRYMSGK